MKFPEFLVDINKINTMEQQCTCVMHLIYLHRIDFEYHSACYCFIVKQLRS